MTERPDLGLCKQLLVCLRAAGRQLYTSKGSQTSWLQAVCSLALPAACGHKPRSVRLRLRACCRCGFCWLQALSGVVAHKVWCLICLQEQHSIMLPAALSAVAKAVGSACSDNVQFERAEVFLEVRGRLREQQPWAPKVRGHASCAEPAAATACSEDVQERQSWTPEVRGQSCCRCICHACASLLCLAVFTGA